MANECGHGYNSDDPTFLNEIEYNETISVKEVALVFTCGWCGSKFTKYYSKLKESSKASSVWGVRPYE